MCWPQHGEARINGVKTHISAQRRRCQALAWNADRSESCSRLLILQHSIDTIGAHVVGQVCNLSMFWCGETSRTGCNRYKPVLRLVLSGYSDRTTICERQFEQSARAQSYVPRPRVAPQSERSGHNQIPRKTFGGPNSLGPRRRSTGLKRYRI